MKIDGLTKRNQSFIIVILLIGVLLTLGPNMLGATTISISRIEVDPQGGAVGSEWVGGFWNIVCVINANEYLAGVQLPEGTEASLNNGGTIPTSLVTNADIQITIDPGQPYLIRGLVEKQTSAAPAAKGSAGAIQPSLTLSYYDWSEPQWRIVTPFTVNVYKDGSLVGSKTIDMAGKEYNQFIPTSEGNIRIENLGLLGSNYVGFSTPSIVLVKNNPYCYEQAQVIDLLNWRSGASATFAKNWYGMTVQNIDGTDYAVNPSIVLQMQLTNVYLNNPGWSCNHGISTPIMPQVNNILYYLQGLGRVNLFDTTFSTRANGNTGSAFQSVDLVKDSLGKATAMKLYVPWGAYGSPTVNIRVPTELADTWVDQPVETTPKISAVWEKTGTTTSDILGSNRIAVTVTNIGELAGTARLTASSNNNNMQVTPTEMTIPNLEPNVPQTVYFSAANLGVSEQVNNLQVTIKAYSSYTNTEKDSVTLTANLLPTLADGTTTLIVRAVEKGTNTGITNLQLHLIYPPDGAGLTKDIFTGYNGYTTSLVLTTINGGAYTGQVVIQGVETSIYKSSSMTFNCVSTATYEAVLEVERKDVEYDDYGWLIYVLAAAVLGVAAFMMLKKKKRGR